MDGDDKSVGEPARTEAAAAPVAASATNKSPSRASRFAVIFFALAIPSGAVGALLASSESPFVYSQMVDEVVDHPATHAGRTLRVEGMLQGGSVRFREDPCEWRFVLEREGRTMPVQFAQCVVPDTFRDGMGISVVVEGRLAGDGSFTATQVIPRCPSRYEMEQRRQAGETMPHSVPPPS